MRGLAQLGVIAANNGGALYTHLFPPQSFTHTNLSSLCPLGANAIGVAEHTVMLMLMVLKNATE